MKQLLKDTLNPRSSVGGYFFPHVAILAALGKALAVVLLLMGVIGGLEFQAHGGLRQAPVNAPIAHVEGGAALPASWSLGKYSIRIHNQGVSNSCVGQSAALMAEIFAKERGITKRYSGGFIWRLVNGGVDQGVSYQAAFTAFAWNGEAPLTAYTNDGGTLGGYPARTAFTAAFPFRVASWLQIMSTDRTTIEAEIHAGRPVAIAIPVYQSFVDNRGATVYSEWGAYRFRHSVVGIGYNATGVVVQNSWTSSWGNHGRTTLSWQFLASIGAEMVTAVPVSTWPHAKHMFPVTHWRSYTSAHHLANQPYRNHGRLTHTSWSWWRDRGLKTRIGVPKHEERWLPRFRVEKLVFTHGLEYHWPTKHSDPVRFIPAKGR